MDDSSKPEPVLEVRYTEASDGPYLREWLSQPSTMRWFAMSDEMEVDDSVKRWIGFARYKCSLTVTLDGVPCGLATLYLQPYRRLAHQSEFGIVVGKEHRGRRVGELLLNSLMDLAKNTFRIELLHLTVYGDNPAIRLYRRFGFQEFGRQTRWLKNFDGTYSQRIFMERIL
ncbi:MAG: GNAT family N-acetyltransferase [Chlamydiales bacterium]|nr:GNAT family N-acetyltransferase [Chlamydiales bacterium]